MKRLSKYLYLGLPVLGVLFYLLYLSRSSIDMVYSDYIRLINAYLPDVWNPNKFFVADLLTRIPVNYLERGLNVELFGYSVAFDRLMGVLGFGASALLLGSYCRKKRIGLGWYTVMMAVMFSLNKWEMLYNGTGWAHFLAFACFYYHYLVLDRVYGEKCREPRHRGATVRLAVLPAVITIGVAGPYCAIYMMTLLLAYLFIWGRNRVIWRLDMQSLKRDGKFGGKQAGAVGVIDSRLCRLSGWQLFGLGAAAVWPFLLYLWSNSRAVYEYSNAVDTPLFTAFFQEPKFFLKFFLKSFASMVFGVEWISRNAADVPGKVWCLVGFLVIAAYVLALWMNFYYGIAKKTILPLMFLAGGGMNHLMVLVSRYIFMPNDAYGMSSRYALQYQMGVLGILMTFALAAKAGWRRPQKSRGESVTPERADRGRRESSVPERADNRGRGESERCKDSDRAWVESRDSRNRQRVAGRGRCDQAVRILAAAFTALFLAGNLMTTAEEFSFGVHRKNHNLESRQILLNYENYTDKELQDVLEYHKDGVRDALTILKEHGWNIYK